ncbi:MAG TPA: bifunctional oligoribonuclease/PAP phosphatase NrnA [Solirubrobacteraceae bacterium]|nr:bifunctional oligoribonuclease/PAP phosphatase NrnA [Solirubrobacteraceae bacterium]
MPETVLTDRQAVLEELRGARRLIAVTHENPDGDALGSLVAMQRILDALGKDCVMFIAADEFPLPYEYRFLPLDGLISEPPADLADRSIVFLDCGNLERNPATAFQRPGAHILNIDHHHDNTRFGTVNLVDSSASCTAEIVWELMRDLDVLPTPTIAEALYVGLITDTGRFMYENTGPRSHRMAAELIEAGVDVHEVYHRIYEDVPLGKLALLARGLSKVERYDDGRLTLTSISAEDFTESGAEESYTEGVVDHLRGVQGTLVAALVRDRVPLDGDGGARVRKVSLRSADNRLDVSVIARQQGGGGHRQAAGFTTELAPEALVAFLRDSVARQLS